MTGSRCFVPCLCLLPWLTWSAQAQFQASDDFNHASRDASKWGASDVGTGDSEWDEGGNRLNFVAPFPSFGASQVSRVWQGRSPSTTNDWTVSVQVQLGALGVLEGEGASVGLSVGNAASPDTRVSVALQLFRQDGGAALRQIDAEAGASGASSPIGGEPTTATSGQLQISFDAHSRMLVVGWGPSGAAVHPIAAWNTLLWGMNAESRFDLRLDAQTVGTSVSVGQVTADNFLINEKATHTLAVLQGSDSFDDHSRNASSWGSMDSTIGMASLDEVGGVTRYSTVGDSGSDDDWAARLWYPGAGEMSKSWSAQVDVALPDPGLAEGEEVRLGLVVLDLSDPGNRLQWSLDVAQDSSAAQRQFQAQIFRGGVESLDAGMTLDTTSTSVALRVRWDAALKSLFLDYDANGPVSGYQWKPLTQYKVVGGDLDWSLGSSSRFQVGFFGESLRATLIRPALNAQFDNFQVTSEGIVVAPIRLQSPQKVAAGWQLKWEGGKGPYQVQGRSAVAGGSGWSNLGAPVNALQTTVTSASNQTFFRILDLGQ